MKCKKCTNSLMQKSEEGLKLRIKGAVTLDEKGMHASCFWCGESATLPKEEISKALLQERYILSINDHSK